MQWLKSRNHANWPLGPLGSRKWSIVSAHGLGVVLPSRPAPTKKMLAPLSVAESSSAKKAVLLPLSSQLAARLSRPSSHLPLANLTAAIVSGELMATVLPSSVTSLPPCAHSSL